MLSSGLLVAESIAQRACGQRRLLQSKPLEASMVDESILKEAADRPVSRFHPQRIILFCSQARQDADGRSDLDLLIICRLKGNRHKLMLAMDRALRGLPIARDIIVLTPEEFDRDKEIPGTVARPASKEGRVLYEGA
jgi:uncharacterized protein